MIKGRQLLLHLLIFWAVNLSAQNPSCRLIDYTAGLPSNTVYNILQDSKGYMWISHEKGLSRYNGQNFNHYSNEMIQSRGLSNLAEDENGKIWCQNFSGEIFYTDGFKLRQNNKLASTGNYIPFEISGGNKLVTTRNNRLIEYDVNTGVITQLSGKHDNYLYINLHTSKQHIYAVKQNNLEITCYQALKKKWSAAMPEGIRPYVLTSFANRVIALPRIGTETYAIIENGKFVKSGNLGIQAIIQNAVYIKDKLWISTTEGAYCYDLSMKLLNNGKPYYKDCNISKIIADSEGSLWLSTLNMGILIVPNLEVKSVGFNEQGITTLSYFPSISKLIAGTDQNNILEIDPLILSSRQLINLGIKNDVIHLYNDIGNDRIWVSSDKLYAIRGATNTIDYTQTIPMKSMVYLDRGYYAMASSEGISLFKTDPDSADQYYALMFTGKPIPWLYGRQLLPGSAGRAKTVAYDQAHGILYASNYKGLFSWSAEGKFRTYTHNKAPIYATDIVIKSGKAFVATFSGKLFELENYSIKNTISGFKGLEGKSITQLSASGDFIWLLYENAVVRYNIFSRNYQVFTLADGLPNSEIKDIAASNGRIFIATRSGLVYFNENLKRSYSEPRLYIDEFLANHSRVEPGNNSKYLLRTNENNLEIKLSVISFRNNSSIKILYNINNQQWTELGGTSRVLNLVGLPPGSYQVKFKAVTIDGRQIPGSEMLRFRIAAPMYTRWWFILLVLLIISAMVFYFMRFRIYELKKEAEFKTARERLERELQISTLASIKSQMNPHFVFNALNTVQSYIFTNDRDNAIDYLSKFSELTRMILDMSNREKITLSEEIKALTLYLELEKRRFEDSFEFSITVNEDMTPDMIPIPSMLIQPYVENAIKHGLLHKKGERKLRIEFIKENNAVVVFIDDNGIGRKKSQELKALKPSSHKSFASEANRKRLQLLNQGRENTIDIEYLDKLDSYGNPLGTMVVLAIPLNF